MVKQVGSHQTKKAKKVHYPSSKFECGKVPTKHKGYGLREVVKEICAKEEDALRPVFGVEGLNAKDAANKKGIHDILLNLMTKLNETIDEDLDDDQESKFKPELSKEERELIHQKQEKLESLTKRAEKLNYFTENLNDFRETTGLWLGLAPAIKVSTFWERPIAVCMYIISFFFHIFRQRRIQNT